MKYPTKDSKGEINWAAFWAISFTFTIFILVNINYFFPFPQEKILDIENKDTHPLFRGFIVSKEDIKYEIIPFEYTIGKINLVNINYVVNNTYFLHIMERFNFTPICNDPQIITNPYQFNVYIGIGTECNKNITLFSDPTICCFSHYCSEFWKYQKNQTFICKLDN